MIKSKHISAIVAVAMAIAVIISMAMFFTAGTYTGKTTEYQTRLFNGEVVEIDIEVDETDWSELLENATTKEYVSADVTMNGDLFSSVGIRTKGNSSLTQVASSDSDRYSLQLNPNKYIKGQSFYGLDNLCINNIVSDSTYMKDAISYDIMEYLGVPTPLRNYAKVTVNGEYYGLCLLLERYDNSFLDRTYNSTTGELYNVKTGMGNGGGGEKDSDKSSMEPPTGDAGGMTPPDQTNDASTSTQTSTADSTSGDAVETQEQKGMQGGTPPTQNGTEPPQKPDGDTTSGEVPAQMAQQETQTETTESDTSTLQEAQTDAETTQEAENGTQQATGEQDQGFGGSGNRGGGMGGGGEMPGSSSGGGGLIYTDDDPESYSSIFDNAVSSKTSDKDKEQVITAIQKLNEGEDIEDYWDVDEILRYFAAHTFVVNLDSYVSNMQQNYYLLEQNGVMSILPWDYNLAFGGFNSGSASEVVNFPIDTPVSGVSMEDRPLLNQLLSVQEYSDKYHEYLNDIVEGYVNGGLFEEEVTRITTEIDSYVQQDTTAFYTYDEYLTGIETLKEIVALRAESVAGQLDGTIPSTTDGQSEDSSSLIDASSIKLSDLGTQGGGGGGGDEKGGGGMGFGKQEKTNDSIGAEQTTTTQFQPETDATSTEESDSETSLENELNSDATQAEGNNQQMMIQPDQLEQLQELQQAAKDGTLTDEQKALLEEIGVTEEQLVQFSEMMGQGGGMQGGGGPNGMQVGGNGTQTTTLTWSDWLVYGVLALLLVAGIIFVAKYPRYKHKNKK